MFKKLFTFTPPKEEYNFEIKKSIPDVKTDEKKRVSFSLRENIMFLDEAFGRKTSYDIKLREFTVRLGRKKVSACIYFIDGLVSNQSVNDTILMPLMVESEKLKEGGIDAVESILLTQNQVSVTDEMDKVKEEICYGSCALFVDGYDKAFLPQVIGWERRGVEEPSGEPAILGSRQAFNETLKTNTSMVRKMIRSEKLTIENIVVGKAGKCNCAVLYMENITNDSLVFEVKRRISSLKIDHIISAPELMQFIENKSFITLPQMLLTERADRCVKAIMAGRVAVLVDNSPFAIIMPITAFELLESAEDIYLRPPYSLLVKIIRLIGIFFSVYLPGIYIAAITYHTEIFPTGMLTTIMKASRKVPFDSVTELLIMVISFEIVREASARVPGFLGQSLGIIGPLVLGQAAISANIVSPVMIIVFSLATIGSFATPNYQMALSGRVLNIFYIILGSTGGFLGIIAGFFCQLVLWHSTKSFGVNMISPFSDGQIFPESFKILPIWKMENRDFYLKPKRIKEQKHISRRWRERDEN